MVGYQYFEQELSPGCCHLLDWTVHLVEVLVVVVDLLHVLRFVAVTWLVCVLLIEWPDTGVTTEW